MKKFLNAIESNDSHALQLGLRDLARSQDIGIDELSEVLSHLPAIVSAFPDHSIVTSQGTEVVWYRYESLIWAVGETFRQIIKQQKQLRNDAELFKTIERVALDERFGKGRESFVMLLGRYGPRESVATLEQLLLDTQVQGHALYALRLLGAGEVRDSVRPFLDSPKAWIRSEAKKYFEKLEKQKPDR